MFLLTRSDTSTAADTPEATQTPLVRVLDLNVGESRQLELCDGKKARVRLLDLQETRDSVRDAVRVAQLVVEVNGQPITLTSSTYHLPLTIAGVQIDCSITRGYLRNSTDA